MRRIDPLGATLEACATRCGTVVGPLLTEIVGHGGSPPTAAAGPVTRSSPAPSARRCAPRRAVHRAPRRALLAEGYRGYFDLDFLIDRHDGEFYLGETQPAHLRGRPLTNHAAFAHADVPLFLFHLLEFSGVEFDLDIAELNARWADPRFIDAGARSCCKSTSADVDQVTAAPQSGLWRLHGNGVAYERFDYRRAAVQDERQGLYLHITGPGDWRYEGADLGILITRGRLMTDDFELTDRAREWVVGELAVPVGGPRRERRRDRAGRSPLQAAVGRWDPTNRSRARTNRARGRARACRVRTHSSRGRNRASESGPTAPEAGPAPPELGPTPGAAPGADRLATLENWERAPWNRWSFQHVRPDHSLGAHQPRARAGAPSCHRSPPAEPGRPPLRDLLPQPDAHRAAGAPVRRRLPRAASRTDRHRAVLQRHGARHAEHLLQSISKSVTGGVVGALVGRGRLDPARPVSDHIAELAGTSFEGATVRTTCSTCRPVRASPRTTTTPSPT